MRPPQRARRYVLLAVLTFFASCENSSTAPLITAVTITPANPTLTAIG